MNISTEDYINHKTKNVLLNFEHPSVKLGYSYQNRDNRN